MPEPSPSPAFAQQLIPPRPDPTPLPYPEPGVSFPALLFWMLVIAWLLLAITRTLNGSRKPSAKKAALIDRPNPPPADDPTGLLTDVYRVRRAIFSRLGDECSARTSEELLDSRRLLSLLGRERLEKLALLFRAADRLRFQPPGRDLKLDQSDTIAAIELSASLVPEILECLRQGEEGSPVA